MLTVYFSFQSCQIKILVFISRIESRNDIKISTLIDYIHACGLGLEIKAIPLKKGKKEEFVLLKSC